MVSNSAPCLPARTGRTPESRACWEELPTEEEMVQVNLHLNEIAGLSWWPCPSVSGWRSRFRTGCTPASSTGVARTQPGDRTKRSPRKKL